MWRWLLLPVLTVTAAGCRTSAVQVVERERAVWHFDTVRTWQRDTLVWLQVGDTVRVLEIRHTLEELHHWHRDTLTTHDTIERVTERPVVQSLPVGNGVRARWMLGGILLTAAGIITLKLATRK